LIFTLFINAERQEKKLCIPILKVFWYGCMIRWENRTYSPSLQGELRTTFTRSKRW